MSDRIMLGGMEFEGHVGVSDEERAEAQVVEMDAELWLDLRAAGASDDLAQTVDYGAVFEICRAKVEQGAYHLLEGLAEAVAGEVLAQHAAVESVILTVRKPGVPIDGVIDHAGVRIERARSR